MADENHQDALMGISLSHPLINILIPKQFKAAVAALWRFDEECAQSLRLASDASLQTIRLIWWRDQLEALEPENISSDNPTLVGLINHLSAAHIKQLSALPDIWADFAELDLGDEAALTAFAQARGGLLYQLTAALCEIELEPFESALDSAGAQWAMSDLANNLSDRSSAQLLWDQVVTSPTPSLPTSLTMLSALTALARSRAQSMGRIRPLREQFLLARYGIFG